MRGRCLHPARGLPAGDQKIAVMCAIGHMFCAEFEMHDKVKFCPSNALACVNDLAGQLVVEAAAA